MIIPEKIDIHLVSSTTLDGSEKLKYDNEKAKYVGFVGQ